MTDYITLSAAETVAEVMLSMGRDKRWNTWFDPDKWNGSTGFYQHVIYVAETLDTYVENANLEWGDDIEWYPTCDNLVEGIFNDEHISKLTIGDFIHFNQAPKQVDAPISLPSGKQAAKNLYKVDELYAELAEFAVQDELPDKIRALLL